MRHHSIQLIRMNQDGTPGAIKYSEEGEGDPPEVIFIDGFERDQAIDLRAFRGHIQQAGLELFEAPITIRETIFKFGETQQLVDDYLLRIEVSYR